MHKRREGRCLRSASLGLTLTQGSSTAGAEARVSNSSILQDGKIAVQKGNLTCQGKQQLGVQARKRPPVPFLI